MTKKKNRAAVALGRRGGRDSRIHLTAEQRTELARQAAAARWRLARLRARGSQTIDALVLNGRDEVDDAQALRESAERLLAAIKRDCQAATGNTPKLAEAEMHLRTALVYLDVERQEAARDCLEIALEQYAGGKDHPLNATSRENRQRPAWRNTSGEREAGLPAFYDPGDPNNPVVLLYQSFFLNAILHAHDTRVSDALAGEPLETYRKFGESSELALALHRWAQSFGIDLEFVTAAAKRAIQNWSVNPEALAKRRWGLSRAGGWTVADRKLSIADKLLYLDPEVDPPEVLDAKYRRFRAHQESRLLHEREVKRVDRKKWRDGRHRFIAFECLVLGHVFRMDDSAIGKKFSLDRRDVARHIKWAAERLGLTPWRPSRGAPRAHQNCANQPAR